MNLRLFEAVVAIHETGSISAAARRCGVSQSALSGQLKDFEAELKVVLVERGRNGALLTPAGREILQRATTVMRCVKEVRQLAEEWGDPCSGKLVLGAIPTLAPYLFPRVMPGLQSAYGRLHFFLREAKTAELLALLASGDLDGAFIATEQPEHPGLVRETLFSEPFVLLAPPGSPWKAGKPARLADVAAGQLLLLEEGHCLGDQIQAHCAATGWSGHADFRGSSMGTLLGMVRLGRGCTLIPKCAVEDADPSCILAPLASPVPHRTITLCWRRASPRHEVFLEIADQVRRLWTGATLPKKR